MRGLLFGAVCFAVAAVMAFAYLMSPRTVAAKVDDPALAKAIKADVFDEATQDVGTATVTCKVYTNDPDAVTLGAPPKPTGWFVQACQATPLAPE